MERQAPAGEMNESWHCSVTQFQGRNRSPPFLNHCIQSLYPDRLKMTQQNELGTLYWDLHSPQLGKKDLFLLFLKLLLSLTFKFFLLLKFIFFLPLAEIKNFTPCSKIYVLSPENVNQSHILYARETENKGHQGCLHFKCTIQKEWPLYP
ncbi:hypothetical protein E2320_020156, partial [Naja naja]